MWNKRWGVRHPQDGPEEAAFPDAEPFPAISRERRKIIPLRAGRSLGSATQSSVQPRLAANGVHFLCVFLGSCPQALWNEGPTSFHPGSPKLRGGKLISSFPFAVMLRALWLWRTSSWICPQLRSSPWGPPPFKMLFAKAHVLT